MGTCPAGVRHVVRERQRAVKVNLHQKTQPIRPDMTLPSPHGRGTGTTAHPLSSSSSSASILPILFYPSSPLHPRKRCFCQNPAALSSGGGMSLSLPLTSTYGLAYSLLCVLTHTEVAPHTPLLAAYTLYPPSRLPPSSLSHSLHDLPHPRSIARLSCPPSCQ